MAITKQLSVNIVLTPSELAEYFCGLDAEQQAMFFNSVSKEVSDNWGGNTLDMQMASVASNPALDKEGFKIMRTIGDAAFQELKDMPWNEFQKKGL